MTLIQAFLLFFALSVSLEAHAKKKLLVLVIASDNHPAFLEQQEIWKSYMNRYPDTITTYFIKGDPELTSEFEIQGNTLYTKTLDNYKPGILKKTILSMQALDTTLDDYDFVLRTNLSSIYDFPKLLKYLQLLPKKRTYAAMPLIPSPEVPAEYRKTPFGWGAGFILSCDLVRLLIAEKETLYAKMNELPDDVSIGMLLHEKGIGIIPIRCMIFTKREEWLAQKKPLPPEIFHFRAKSHYVTRRLEDFYEDELFIASELTKQLYPDVSLKSSYHTTYPLQISLTTVYKFHEAAPNPNIHHLTDLKRVAKSCSSALEIGTKDVVSTWALLKGLAESGQENLSYVGIFNETPPSQDLLLAHKLATSNSIAFKYLKNGDMTIKFDPVDLVLLPYFRTEDIEKFAPFTKKYFFILGTGKRDIESFLILHPEWQVKEEKADFIILEHRYAYGI